uniref:Lipase n=1 Tax=Hirondellea gigas TaxID=1518452 RepID=A0A2P2I6Z9_9CRUS
MKTIGSKSLLLLLLAALVGSSSAVKFNWFRTQHTPTVPELISENGYPVEIHTVVTIDGYILEMHRIPHGIMNITSASSSTHRPPVLLHHGLFSSSADFLMNDPQKALGYMLADAGYDVWLANCRGNQYSRGHMTLNPDEEAEFWKFSWDQIAIYDLATEIEYVLAVSESARLSYVGYSMGTTVFFALLSEIPEYAVKVKVMAAMAPVAFMAHIEGLVKVLSHFSKEIDFFLNLMGVHEMLPGGPDWDELVLKECGEPYSSRMKGCIGTLTPIVGGDLDEFQQEYLPEAFAQTPAGASKSTLLHYAQLVLSKKFRKFDYGSFSQNLEHYGQLTPTEYDLTKVRTPIALFVGLNDYLADRRDVDKLNSLLPNVIRYKFLNYPRYNHLDFIWGKHAAELVYVDIIGLFNKYNHINIKGQQQFFEEDVSYLKYPYNVSFHH